MRRLTLSLTALAVAATCGATAAHASSLIVNGSFESGDLTGWTSNAPSGLNPFGASYGVGMDGTYWHWLSGYEAPITTSQTVSGLSIGATYTLSWIMASEFSNSDSLRVSIDGGPGTIFTADPIKSTFWDNWQSKTLSFVASGTSANIQFDSVGLNASGYDVGLDNVNLSQASSAVPEPATWAMLLLGFGMIGFAMRKRSNVRTTVSYA